VSSTADSAALLTLAEARVLWEAREWPALAARGALLPDEALAAEPELGFLVAGAAHRVGDATRALSLALVLEGEVRRRGARRLLLDLLNLIGIALYELGRNDEAEARFTELLETATGWGDDEFAGRASNNMGVLANIRGQRDLALTSYQRAVAAYQRMGWRRGLAQTHYNIGISYRDLGFEQDADGQWRRALELAEPELDEDVMGFAEVERALLKVRGGDPRMGQALAERARARFEKLGDPVRRAEAVRVLAAADRALGRVGEARARLDDALREAVTHSNPLLHAEVQRDRGLLLRDLGDAAGAREALEDAAAHFERIGAAAEAEAVRTIVAALPADSSPSG
jgi:tetratricopeptide (TPR) repeat protein